MKQAKAGKCCDIRVYMILFFLRQGKKGRKRKFPSLYSIKQFFSVGWMDRGREEGREGGREEHKRAHTGRECTSERIQEGKQEGRESRESRESIGKGNMANRDQGTREQIREQKVKALQYKGLTAGWK